MNRLRIAAFAVFLCAGSAATVRIAAADTSAAPKIAVGAPEASSRLAAMQRLSATIRRLLAPGTGAAAIVALAATGAAYGVLHALGPGHQKTLITGQMIAEGGGFARAIGTAAVASASHAVSVTALFGGLALLTGGLSAAAGERTGMITAKISAALLAVLAAWMLAVRIKKARKRLAAGNCGHERDCGCGHHGHEKVRRGEAGGTAMIVLGSLAPCPGAALFLLLGFSAGNPAAGILAVAAISAGMWLTLSAIGCAAVVLRRAGDRKARARGGRAASMAISAFEVGGSALVLAFAAAMLFF